MKKVFFTAFAAMAFAFAMTACGGDNKQETKPNQEQQAGKDDNNQKDQPCDSFCKDSCQNYYDCTNCPRKGTDQCCKAKAGDAQGCCKEGHEGCQGDHKCQKAEGEGCCKKGEAKECEHKCKHEGEGCCKKAEGNKECEHKCQKNQ